MMMKKRLRYDLYFVLIFLIMHSVSSGQTSESSTIGSRFSSDLSDAFNGSVHIVSRPIQWQGSDWLNFGYVIAGAVAISFIDTEVRDFLLRNPGGSDHALIKIGEFYGEPLSVVLITGSIYLFGNIADNGWARETAVIMTAALIPGGIYQTTAKMAAGRARPYLELGYSHFEPFRMEEDYYSFVSGHTLVATATSLVLASRINNIIAKGAFYSLGLLTGISRLYSDDHWLSDVFLGASLAAAVTQSATVWHNNLRQFQSGALNFRILPLKNGITLSLTW
jgi:membrane-associated phospholipid phosphatase